MTNRRVKTLAGARGTTLRQVLSPDGSFRGIIGTIRDLMSNGYFVERLRSYKGSVDDWCFISLGLNFYYGKNRIEALREEEGMCQG